jgi:Terminase large subunit, T4likevirus-type, N-terminal
MKIISKSLRQKAYTQKVNIHDAKTFVETYLSVSTSQPFILRPYQERIFAGLLSGKNTIILAPRQSGLTSAVLAFMLWEAVANNNYIGVFFSLDATNSLLNQKKIIEMLEDSPDWLKSGILTVDKQSICFTNGSKILFNSSANDLRGLTISRIYLDNFPYMKEQLQAEIFHSICHLQIGKISMGSCPKTYGDIFHNIWVNSFNKNPTWANVRVLVTELPYYTHAWENQVRATISQEAWRRCYACEFFI